MNVAQFYTLVKDPNKFDSIAIADIESLLVEFPWFQTAHLLIVQSLQARHDIRFKNRLHLAAAHLPDREKLYNTLHAVVNQIDAETNKNDANTKPTHPDQAESIEIENKVLDNAIETKLKIAEIESFMQEHNMLLFDFETVHTLDKTKISDDELLVDFDFDKKSRIPMPDLSETLHEIQSTTDIIQKTEVKPKPEKITKQNRFIKKFI